MTHYYKRIIDRYLSGKHLRQTEYDLVIKFYFDVEEAVDRDVNHRRMNTQKTVLSVGHQYRMTDEEADMIYRLGTDIMDTIDRFQFINNKS